MLAAPLLHRVRAGADLDSFYCVDAHHRVRNVRIQTVEYRFAQAWRHTGGDNCDACTDRVALFANLPDQIFQLFHASGIGAEERILVRELGLYRVERERADLAEVTVDVYAETLLQIFA